MVEESGFAPSYGGSEIRTAGNDLGGRAIPEAGSSARPSWGIRWVPWLWTTRIRILFVIDGRINMERGEMDFGLGLVLDTLLDPAFAWWVRFDVEVGVREPNGFRFTQDGFDIRDYDQVWFFGDWPGEVANTPPSMGGPGDEVIEDAAFTPLNDNELGIVARWMRDEGGGVFAAGDHSLLGASMCYRIPRVRTMRRWTYAQGVPSFDGADKHETLQHAPGGNHASWEGDRWPQRIFPVYRQDPDSPIIPRLYPHPLLCGHEGVIDRFPDHMHEGSVIEDDEVELNKPLGIPGFSGPEYPTAGPSGPRPRPEVIAYGLTTHSSLGPRRFPLIGVYDGDPVAIGRVVVDSTWHHWFSWNLVGLRNEVPTFYRGMQDYYRNVALWLSSPAQRASMLSAATWGALVGLSPGFFDAALGMWGLGERVVDVIGRSAPQCILDELVVTLLRTGAPSVSQQGSRLQPSQRMVNEIIVGSIAMRLVGLSQHHLVEHARGRSTRLDGDAIRDRCRAGISDGIHALSDALAEGEVRFAALREDLEAVRSFELLDGISVDLPVEEPTD
jgi:hypothetical protein